MRKKTKDVLIHLPIVLILVFSLFYTSFFSFPATLQADELIEGTLQDIITSYTNNTTNLNNFTIKSEQSFLFTNTTENKVKVWLEDETLEFGSFGGSPQNFVTPSLITSLPNGSIYVYDSLRRLKLFSDSYEFVDNFNLIQTPTTYLSMGRIASITNDLKNNLYALDYENNMVLKKSASQNEVVMLLNATELGLTLTQHSQIIVSPNGEYIFLKNVNNENNIYYLKNLSLLTQINLPSYGISTVSEIAIDCANNLFVLEKNETLSLLHKFTRNTYNYESFLFVNNNALNNLTNFKINVETGTMFALNSQTNTLQTITPTNYAGTFSENILSFTHPINYITPVALSQSVAIANITTADTLLLQTPYNITPLHTLQINQKVIILSETVADNDDYNYVLYVNAISGQNVAGYILKTHLETLGANTPQILAVRILNNNTKLYKYPSTLTTSDQILTVGTANKNEEFVVLNTANDIIDANQTSFFAISLSDNTMAYVRFIDVVATNITSITPTLFTNAEIIITDNSSSVTVYENTSTLQVLPYTLQEGTRIYIESYNGEEIYTQIKFLNQTGEEITGYIQTKFIKVHGDYNNLLQAFILSSVSFILIVILFVAKTRKKAEEN